MPRRTRRALAVIAAAAPLAVLPVREAEPSALLCEREEVLRIVERTLRGWNRYNRIREDTVGEAPTSVANAVTCEITMATIGYVETPAGWIPRPAEERRHYHVQVIANRLHVLVPP